jgi:phosphoribosylformylglycinamidine synthase subunit PurQ / glutaminase
MTQPKAIVLHAAGTNRDPDACVALKLAGAEAEIVHINQLRSGERRLGNYQLLVIPGGFSYADALGAGKLFALDLASYFADQAAAFVDAGKPVIGICNGFQVLVKAGILPGFAGSTAASSVPGSGEGKATLAHNEKGRFESRWSTMDALPSNSVWSRNLPGRMSCPIAHGEGRFVVDSDTTLAQMREGGQIALVYVNADGSPASGEYPANPNGSAADIAGICNRAGNVIGLMPHPENNVVFRERYGANGRAATEACLALWKNGVAYARGM